MPGQLMLVGHCDTHQPLTSSRDESPQSCPALVLPSRVRKSRQAACTALATSLLVLTTYQRKPWACTSAPALLLLLSGTPPGVPSFILASELLRLVGREAHPTSPLVLACQSPRSVLAPLPESYPLGSIDTESLCERNTESIYAVVN